jgi:hypothetical protein
MASNASGNRARLDRAYADCCTDPVNGVLVIVTNLDAVAQLDTYRGLFAPCWLALADELFAYAEENTTIDAEAQVFAESYDGVFQVTELLSKLNNYAETRPSLIHLLAIPAIAAAERSRLTLGHMHEQYDEDIESADLTTFLVKKNLLRGIPTDNARVAMIINFVLKSNTVLGKAIVSFLTHMHWAAYIPNTTRRLTIEFAFTYPTSQPPQDFSSVRFISSTNVGRLHVFEDLEEAPFPQRLHFESLLYLIVDVPFNVRHDILVPQLEQDMEEIDLWSFKLAWKFGLHLVMASDVLRRVRGPIVNKYYDGSYTRLLMYLFVNDPEFFDIPEEFDRRGFHMARFIVGGSYGPLEKVLVSLFHDIAHGTDDEFVEAGLFVRDIFLATAFYFDEIGFDRQADALANFNLLVPANAHKRGERMREMAQIGAESAVHSVVRADPRNMRAVERLRELVNSAKYGLGVDIFNLKTSLVIDGEPTPLTPIEWMGTLDFPTIQEYTEAFRYTLKKSPQFGLPRSSVIASAWTDGAKRAWLGVKRVAERLHTVSGTVDALFELHAEN